MLRLRSVCERGTVALRGIGADDLGVRLDAALEVLPLPKTNLFQNDRYDQRVPTPGLFSLTLCFVPHPEAGRASASFKPTTRSALQQFALSLAHYSRRRYMTLTRTTCCASVGLSVVRGSTLLQAAIG